MKHRQVNNNSAVMRIKLHNETIELVKKQAEHDGVSITQVINKVLSAALRSQDSIHEELYTST